MSFIEIEYPPLDFLPVAATIKVKRAKSVAGIFPGFGVKASFHPA
jgi:hypothetical protein